MNYIYKKGTKQMISNPYYKIVDRYNGMLPHWFDTYEDAKLIFDLIQKIINSFT